MKLIIQIPCLNEAKTLPETIRDLPRNIANIDEIEYLVINDGSDDDTLEVARSLGVHHVLDLGSNRGLARAFSAGIDYSLEHGADIVVNTDADNQYFGGDIERLVQPILKHKADIVVGCRPIKDHEEFGLPKKILQLLGSWILRRLSKTTVRDAASGFRAFSRETCMRLFVYSRFSYCMETLIQAGNSGIRVSSVNIRVNPTTRPSRLFKNIPQYIYKSGGTMLNMFILYRPGTFFISVSSVFFAVTLGLGFRFLWLIYIVSEPNTSRTYLPSLILLALCALIAIFLFFLGILGELSKSQRKIGEENMFLLKKKIYATNK
jgi:glycosyltransferase involved in cell wall biosynthesis